MLNKSQMAGPEVIEGWLQDLGIATTRRTDPASNWALEFTVAGPSPLVLSAVNPKSVPRAVMIICGMSAAPAHTEAFDRLDERAKAEFWKQLRETLNREFVEFQVDGAGPTECPKQLRVTAIRFDDGLTLDSFARSLSSVCKACADAVAHFTDSLGEPAAPTEGDFAFKKVGTQ